MRKPSLRTSEWPRISSRWTSHTPRETGRGMPSSAARYRYPTITPNQRRSAVRGHLGPGESDKPSHLDPRSLRISGDLAGDAVAGSRIGRGPDVFFDLLSPPATMFVVPEVEIAPAPNGLHAITTAKHHGTTLNGMSMLSLFNDNTRVGE